MRALQVVLCVPDGEERSGKRNPAPILFLKIFLANSLAANEIEPSTSISIAILKLLLTVGFGGIRAAGPACGQA
jgi:hypothetical protein